MPMLTPDPDDPLQTQRVERVDVRSFLPSPLKDNWHRGIDPATRRAVLLSLHRLLSALTTYLPRHLLYELMSRPVPGRAYGEFFYSTVLFADLSGFTAMSEQLAALGREGAETLTRVVNDYFTTMNEIAAHHSGDLMLFGGDAMLLLFDGIDHALRACHTAWHMQQTMVARFAEVQTTLGAFPLRMAAGLGSGPTFTAALGSIASMHYCVMGPALVAMGRAEALAGGGRILLDEATQVLAGAIRVESEREPGYLRLVAEPTQPFARPEPPVLDRPPADDLLQIDWLADRIAAIVPFLPPGLLPRLLPDPAAVLEGEHRPVTILFIDFRDADALIDQLGADDPNAITPRLNAAFDAARAIVARYDGVVNKISGGPAGPHVIGLFGAPRSHEDDPERAVQAALEIQTSLASADLPGAYPARIGVNTGFVYAANVGSRARREYTVMGDQVNLAARLMKTAKPGEIVVSASTALHVQHRFNLDEREPVMVKGKSQLQRNFLVRGARSRSIVRLRVRSGQLLGRDQELAAGLQRVETAQQGRGQLLSVNGEAGVGKSRLVEAWVQAARERRFEVIHSACASYGGEIPYSVWVEPLRELIGLQPSDPEADRRAKVQSVLAEIGRVEDAALLGEIIGVTVADSALTSALDAQARQRRLFDAVVELIRWRAEQRPLLWIVDDAHWIDPTSRDLLNYLALRIDDAAVLLVVTCRPEGQWASPDGVTDLIEIELGLLDRPAIERLVAEMLDLHDGRLPLPIQTLMQRMTTGVLSDTPADEAAFERYWGNPFFTQERIRALIESGVLVREAPGQGGGAPAWQVTRPIESIEMPDTIHGVIMSRIDRLSEGARRALQVAAVIGRTADLDLLRAVYYAPGANPESLQRHLRDLGDLGLSLLEDEPGRSRCTFRNVTTQEVAYENLRYEWRRELHRRIAQQIEARPDLVDDPSSLMAHHYFAGQTWDKALGYALEAGWRAQQKYANAAAAGAYRRALRAAESLSPPRTLEQLAAHEALGDVLTLMGEYDDALSHFQAAQTLAQDDRRHLADLCRKVAEVRERQSAYDDAFGWLQRGLEYAAPDSIEAARAYLIGAGVFHRQGKHDQAHEWCERSLRIARALSDDAARRAEARALYLLAEILRKRGDLDPAIDSARRAVNVYLLAGDVAGQSQALNTLANTYSDKGDLVAATRFYTDSLHLKERVGDVGGQAILTLNLGEAYRVLGNLDEARQAFERSLRICRDLRNSYAVALLHNNLAAIAIVERNWDEADRRLRESNRLFDEIGSEDFKAELLRHQAELELGLGQNEAALHHAHQAVTAAEAVQERLEVGLSRCVHGQAHLALGDLAKAEGEMQASLEVLEELGNSVGAAGTRLVLAQLRRQQGRVEEANRLIEAAVATYESIGAEALKARALAG